MFEIPGISTLTKCYGYVRSDAFLGEDLLVPCNDTYVALSNDKKINTYPANNYLVNKEATLVFEYTKTTEPVVVTPQSDEVPQFFESPASGVE